MIPPYSIVRASTPSEMPDAAKSELFRSLGRVVRGLSALFWGLPAMLVIYVQTARTDWLDLFGSFAMLPAVMVSGVPLLALWQMSAFQRQERVWIQSLHRTEVLGVINLGLAPFLFWWHRLPAIPFYAMCVGLLALSSVLFLLHLNIVLRRLAAMLPDETLRAETSLFTRFNYSLLAAVFFLLTAYFAFEQIESRPQWMTKALSFFSTQGLWLVLFLILMPLAMTMALVWKIKEVIFASVIEAR
jgi:hypothetical protein